MNAKWRKGELIMKVIMDRNEKMKETKTITILIGMNKYRLSESVEGNLVINKTIIDDGDENIMVLPKYANQIELT